MQQRIELDAANTTLRAQAVDLLRAATTDSLTQVANRGLIMVLDKDELAEGVMTENDAVAYLTNRLKLNQIRRASALLIAAATDQARTWTSGTRDADMDMITEVNNYQAAAGIGWRAQRHRNC